MDYISLKNFRGSKGSILVTILPVPISPGDHYIGHGFSGENIFIWSESQARDWPNQTNRKVIAVSYDFDIGYSGIVANMKLPRIDI